MAHKQLAALRRMNKPEVLGRVYVVRNSVDSNSYVGSTLLALSQRLKSHKGMAGLKRSPLHRLMCRLGNETFRIEELEQVVLRGTPEEQQQQLSERESRWILELRPSLNMHVKLTGAAEELEFIRRKMQHASKMDRFVNSETRNECFRRVRLDDPEKWRVRIEAGKARYWRNRETILRKNREKREQGLYVQKADLRHLELEDTDYKFKSRLLVEQLRWMCRLQEACE